MKKILSRVAFFAVFALCVAACDKQETIEIPDTLEGTEWGSYDVDLPITFSMEFVDATHARYTRTVYEPQSHEVVEEVEYDYTYEYAKPAVEMTPLTEGAPHLTGEVLNHPKMYNCLILNGPDGEPFLTAYHNYYYYFCPTGK